MNADLSEMCIVVPITTTNRMGCGNQVMLLPEDGVATRSFAICDQVRAISRRRLGVQMGGPIRATKMEQVEALLKVFLKLSS